MANLRSCGAGGSTGMSCFNEEVKYHLCRATSLHLGQESIVLDSKKTPEMIVENQRGLPFKELFDLVRVPRQTDLFLKIKQTCNLKNLAPSCSSAWCAWDQVEASFSAVVHHQTRSRMQMCLTANMNFIRSQARCSIEVLLLDYKVVVAQTVLLGPGSSLSTHGITCFRCRCRDLNDLNTWFLQIFRDSPWELQLLWQRMQSCCQRCNHWKWLFWSLCCYAVVVVFAPHTVSLKHETWVDRTEALKAEYLDSEFCASCPFTALLIHLSTTSKWNKKSNLKSKGWQDTYLLRTGMSKCRG